MPTTLLMWLTKVLGILATALAVSLGAPFWFDLLSRFMLVRSAIEPEAVRPKARAGGARAGAGGTGPSRKGGGRRLDVVPAARG